MMDKPVIDWDAVPYIHNDRHPSCCCTQCVSDEAEWEITCLRKYQAELEDQLKRAENGRDQWRKWHHEKVNRIAELEAQLQATEDVHIKTEAQLQALRAATGRNVDWVEIDGERVYTSYDERLRVENKALREALIKIACYDDKGAQRHFETTGSYTCFDEPYAAEIARAALEGKQDA